MPPYLRETEEKIKTCQESRIIVAYDATVWQEVEVCFFQLSARAQNGRGGGVVIQSLPRLRLCYTIVMLTGGGFPFHLVHFSISPGFPACPAFPPPATLPS